MSDEQYVEIRDERMPKHSNFPEHGSRGSELDYVHIGELGLDEKGGLSKPIYPCVSQVDLRGSKDYSIEPAEFESK